MGHQAVSVRRTSTQHYVDRHDRRLKRQDIAQTQSAADGLLHLSSTSHTASEFVNDDCISTSQPSIMLPLKFENSEITVLQQKLDTALAKCERPRGIIQRQRRVNNSMELNE